MQMESIYRIFLKNKRKSAIFFETIVCFCIKRLLLDVEGPLERLACRNCQIYLYLHRQRIDFFISYILQNELSLPLGRYPVKKVLICTI